MAKLHNELKSEFTKSFRIIVFISKLSGLFNFSYCFNSNNTMTHKVGASHLFGDIIQLGFYVLMSFVVLTSPTYVYIFRYDIIRYWIILITTRGSAKWMIKLINELLKYDGKFSNLPRTIQLRAPGVNFWSKVVILYCIYFWAIHFVIIPSTLKKIELVQLFVGTSFGVPRLVDFAVLTTTCFFLGNFGCRFRALNEFWKSLIVSFEILPEYWTNEDIVMIIECCRLLHADLCTMLRMFSLAYGPVLLVSFLFFIVDIVHHFFIIGYIDDPYLSIMPAVISILQFIFYISVILTLGSWSRYQKNMIILNIRSTQVANLPENVFEQVLFFMEQVSSYEYYELSAFGVFDYDLTLISWITVFVFKCVITKVQMDENSSFNNLVNVTFPGLVNNTEDI